jgi:hypothetical protein
MPVEEIDFAQKQAEREKYLSASVDKFYCMVLISSGCLSPI